MPHLVTYITAHGYGHISQTGPVLAALAERLPDLRLTVVSTAPEAQLRRRIPLAFHLIPRAGDFGFCMEDALHVDQAASARAYQDFHRHWPDRVTEEAAFLRTLVPDLVLANTAYLPLAAAAQAGVPALGMSSLNWADLFAAIFPDPAWAQPLHEEILAAYRSARGYIRLAPAMTMGDLPRTWAVGPVAALGRPAPAALRRQLGVSPQTRLVLVALGGFPTRLPVENWPTLPDVVWLVPQDWRVVAPQARDYEPLEWRFTDLLASVDALVGKPGYGTFAEAGCNGVPMLYVRRPGWAEQEALIPWLERHGRCGEVSQADLLAGHLGPGLEALWAQTAPPCPPPTGAREGAAILAAWLGAGEVPPFDADRG